MPWALSAGEFDGDANVTAAADGGQAGSSVDASNQAAAVEAVVEAGDAIEAADAVEPPRAEPIDAGVDGGVGVDGDTDAEGDGNMGKVAVSELGADLQPTPVGTADAPLTPPPEAPAPAPALTPTAAGRRKASAPRTYEGTSDLAEIEADMKATIATSPMLAWAESLVEVFAQIVYFFLQLSKAWQLFREGVELVLSSNRDDRSDDADRRRAGPSIGATQTYLESLPTEQNGKQPQEQEQQQQKPKQGGDEEDDGGNEGPGLWARLFRRGESAGAEAEAKAEAEAEDERPRVEVDSPPAGQPGRGAQLLDAAIPNRQRRMSERFMADVRTMLKNDPSRIRQFQIETDNFRNGVLSAKVS